LASLYHVFPQIRCEYILMVEPLNMHKATLSIRGHLVILLLQSALQALWVLACTSIVEYSQQEGFYRVPLPAARQTPDLEGQ